MEKKGGSYDGQEGGGEEKPKEDRNQAFPGASALLWKALMKGWSSPAAQPTMHTPLPTPQTDASPSSPFLPQKEALNKQGRI